MVLQCTCIIKECLVYDLTDYSLVLAHISNLIETRLLCAPDFMSHRDTCSPIDNPVQMTFVTDQSKDRCRNC